jgi:hypothetical protein
MLSHKRAIEACLALGLLLRTGAAAAQEDAAAEALFNKGLSEMEAGRYETACPTLKESQRLDPRMGTLFTLAECEAKGGMIASAVAHYDEYLRLFGRLSPQQKTNQAGREKISLAQKTALTPLVPHVTLVVRDAPAGTTVKWDDLVFNLPALGVPLPVNPGDHVVTTQAAGHAAATIRVTVHKSERKEVALKIGPKLAPKEPAAVAAASASSNKPAPLPSPTEEEIQDSKDEAASRRVWLYGTGAIGVVGVVVGTVTGAVVLGKKGTVDDNCEGTRCNAMGKDAADSAQSLGTVSTIGFGVGIAGLATAAMLALTEPKSPNEARTWTPLVAQQKDGVVLGLARAW